MQGVHSWIFLQVFLSISAELGYIVVDERAEILHPWKIYLV